MTAATATWTELLERTAELEAIATRATDRGNAHRFYLDHGDDVMYCDTFKRWFVWDGTRWRLDDKLEVKLVGARVADKLREIARLTGSVKDAEALEKRADKLESRSGLDNMLVRAMPLVAVTAAELDAHPDLLNVANGTLDLGRDRRFLEPDRAHKLTKCARAAFDPQATAPVWLAFLERVLPDPEVRDFAQRAAGYSLLGTVLEHVLLVPFGPGGTGKSTFLEIALHVLGDYGQRAPTSLLVGRHDAIPTDVARLKGARFVAASESKDGASFDDARLKELTGGDTITARKLHENFEEFTPAHTLWLATNHRPNVDGTDDAIWRRLRLIPFETVIPPAERDPTLLDRLRAEADGILMWFLEGLDAYRRDGLSAPPSVTAATEEYRRESDPVGRFIDEMCVEAPHLAVELGRLHDAYTWWAHENGETPLSKIAFGKKVPRRFEKRKSGVARWHGLDLRV